MPNRERARELEDFILDLYGGDPFSDVYTACERHREEHGPDCGVYPSNPAGMRVVSVLVRATGAKRILEVGCGLGYSTLHLASAAGAGATVDTVEMNPEHAELARQNFADAGLQVNVLVGRVDAVLPTISGPYDFVYDDGWFASEPPHLDPMIDLVRPGGLLVMPNWFLLDDAFSDEPRMDWSTFAGPDWADHTKAYAQRLASHPGLFVAFDLPLLAIAVKR